MARGVKPKVVASEVSVSKADEIVAVLCVVKPGAVAQPDSRMEVVGFGNAVILGPDQYTKMARSRAEWHIGKANRNDATNPLTLVIKELGEVSESSGAEE